MLDYLIVGFGLGGLHLAHLLEENGKTFLILNDRSQKASKIAGGLCNPVALNNFRLVPDGSKNLQLAKETYQTLEHKLGIQVCFPMPIHRKFNSEKDRNDWFLALKTEKLKPFLNRELIPSHQHIQAKYGFGEVAQSVMVQMPKLLTSFEQSLSKRKKYRATHFEHSLLKIEKEHVTYKNIQARKIIFCEGFGMKQNIFFNYLPFSGNKGEYLILHAPALQLRETIKSSFFLLPLGNDQYKFGATYEHQFDNQDPSENAGKKLVFALDELIDCPYSIIDQVAGIRPTVPDRKPSVGQHPQYSNMFVCNGFASRGILNAPRMAKELVAFMENNMPLPSEIDIARFEKKWFVWKNC